MASTPLAPTRPSGMAIATTPPTTTTHGSVDALFTTPVFDPGSLSPGSRRTGPPEISPAQVPKKPDAPAPAPLKAFDPNLLEKGEIVHVASRTWPGINKPGGAGKISAVNDDGTYDVQYVLGGTDRRIPKEFVHRTILGTDGQRSHKPRDFFIQYDQKRDMLAAKKRPHSNTKSPKRKRTSTSSRRSRSAGSARSASNKPRSSGDVSEGAYSENPDEDEEEDEEEEEEESSVKEKDAGGESSSARSAKVQKNLFAEKDDDESAEEAEAAEERARAREHALQQQQQQRAAAEQQARQRRAAEAAQAAAAAAAAAAAEQERRRQQEAEEEEERKRQDAARALRLKRKREEEERARLEVLERERAEAEKRERELYDQRVRPVIAPEWISYAESSFVQPIHPTMPRLVPTGRLPELPASAQSWRPAPSPSQYLARPLVTFENQENLGLEQIFAVQASERESLLAEFRAEHDRLRTRFVEEANKRLAKHHAESEDLGPQQRATVCTPFEMTLYTLDSSWRPVGFQRDSKLFPSTPTSSSSTATAGSARAVLDGVVRRYAELRDAMLRRQGLRADATYAMHRLQLGHQRAAMAARVAVFFPYDLDDLKFENQESA